VVSFLSLLFVILEMLLLFTTSILNGTR
jgi:hypothetical protein